MLPIKLIFQSRSEKNIEIFGEEDTILNWHRFFPSQKKVIFRSSLNQALWKTNCSTNCIQIMRSIVFRARLNVDVVVITKKQHNSMIWSHHNLDQIKDNCCPRYSSYSEDRIQCTVYTGLCPHPHYIHITAWRFRLATSSRHTPRPALDAGWAWQWGKSCE